MEGEAFRDMILYARGSKGRQSDLPHRTKVSDYINDLGDEIQRKMKVEFELLPPGRQISLMFDVWTSATMITMSTATGDYRACSFSLVSYLGLTVERTLPNVSMTCW